MHKSGSAYYPRAQAEQREAQAAPGEKNVEQQNSVGVAPPLAANKGDGAGQDAGMKASATTAPAADGGRYTDGQKQELPPPPPDLNHFYPRDPTLPAELQDPHRTAWVPSSQAEIDRRNRQFDRAHGMRRRNTPSGANRNASDWDIVNGR